MFKQSKVRLFRFHQGSIDDRHLLGAKGASLCDLEYLKLPVPPGFIVSNETCIEYFKHPDIQNDIMKQLVGGCRNEIRKLEKSCGATFGMDSIQSTDGNKEYAIPLLLSVRCSSVMDMPGMMDTVLNVGINDKVVEVMETVSGNPHWAFDTYRRFIQMYGTVVLNVDGRKYEDILARGRQTKGVEHDSLLDVAELKQIVAEFKAITPFPDDVYQQLSHTMEAIYRLPRTVKYRKMHNIPHDANSAVVIQTMVFGNLNSRSGSGVLTTRNPTTGEHGILCEFRPNALGQDVVTGGQQHPPSLSFDQLRDAHMDVHGALVHIAELLENRYRDVQVKGHRFGLTLTLSYATSWPFSVFTTPQTIEFTVQNGDLYVLETRRAWRTAKAAARFAVAFVVEKKLSERDALLRIDPRQMMYFMNPIVDPNFENTSAMQDKVMGRGRGGFPGTASGRLEFTSEAIRGLRAAGEECILVREDCVIDNFDGLADASGALFLHGGLTSDVSMLMRSMNKPVVVGESGLRLNREKQELTSADGAIVLHAGDIITIDGSTGTVYMGAVPFVVSGQDDYFSTVLAWADKYKKVQVQATVASRHDLKKAKELGAEGVGLYKTEHLFYQSSCMGLFQHVLMATCERERAPSFERLHVEHAVEFVNLFRGLNGVPVKIRLLHEPPSAFLPSPHMHSFTTYVTEAANCFKISYEDCFARIVHLQEDGQTLGGRCRTLHGICYDIHVMQIKAIASAVLDARHEGLPVNASIIIPPTMTKWESELLVHMIRETCLEVCQDANFSLKYLTLALGAMIESPIGCAKAGQTLAMQQCVDSIGIDTNSLTELVYGMTREDNSATVTNYTANEHVFPADPFTDLDEMGIGELLRSTVHKCKKANNSATVTVYGDHTTSKQSLRFLTSIGVDAVCCDPHQVPIVKIAAAQARIEDDKTVSDRGRATFSDLPFMGTI